jgi:hypothetical protein
MLTLSSHSFSIKPIIDQVKKLDFGKRLELNNRTGTFFNDPWEIKDEFKNTPLGDVLNVLGDIGQARLLRLTSGETYTAHYDPDDRIHLAIQSNPYSYLVDIGENKLYHLPVDGNVWYMDTGKLHVASNWGANDRIHLNIRVLLPKFSMERPYVRLTIYDDSYDWKQKHYLSVMGFINRKIKQKVITGFHSTDERVLFINTDDLTIFDNVVGTGVEISKV